MRVDMVLSPCLLTSQKEGMSWNGSIQVSSTLVRPSKSQEGAMQDIMIIISPKKQWSLVFLVLGMDGEAPVGATESI